MSDMYLRVSRLSSLSLTNNTLELYVRQTTGGTASIAKVLEWSVAWVRA